MNMLYTYSLILDVYKEVDFVLGALKDSKRFLIEHYVYFIIETISSLKRQWEQVDGWNPQNASYTRFKLSLVEMLNRDNE